MIDRKNDQEFYNLSFDLNTNMKEIIEDIADELSVFMKKRIPEHLISEYQIYTQLIAGVRILSQTIEECIKEGMLSEPEKRIGAEGVVMIVEKITGTRQGEPSPCLVPLFCFFVFQTVNFLFPNCL